MRAVVQRVHKAEVVVGGQVVGSCGQGLCLLVAAHRNDTVADAEKLANKTAHLRIFSDAQGKMNLSLLDLVGAGVGVGVLAVSNFTVYGDAAKQRRPSFMDAAPYEEGQVLFDCFVSRLRAIGLPVQTGVFGTHMEVGLVNDGPVTLILES
ncbi:MAG: D-aminoacyl-tRNA deacylase [Chthonomonas sp.]